MNSIRQVASILQTLSRRTRHTNHSNNTKTQTRSIGPSWRNIGHTPCQLRAHESKTNEDCPARSTFPCEVCASENRRHQASPVHVCEVRMCIYIYITQLYITSSPTPTSLPTRTPKTDIRDRRKGGVSAASQKQTKHKTAEMPLGKRVLKQIKLSERLC